MGGGSAMTFADYDSLRAGSPSGLQMEILKRRPQRRSCRPAHTADGRTGAPPVGPMS